MNEQNTPVVSGLRLRIGVVCIVLWWIPFWAFGPAIADALGVKSSIVTGVIVALQTVLGFLGIWVAGSQVAGIIKGTPKKQIIGKVWHVLIHGSL